MTSERPRIDLYSDTQTRPSRAMREAMANAEVGDEQRNEDPTVRELCAMTAELLGKDAALFLPVGDPERREAAPVLHVQRRAFLDQPQDDVVRAPPGRPVQRRVAVVVGGVHVAAERERHLERLERLGVGAAVLVRVEHLHAAGRHDRRRPARVRQRDVGPVLREQAHQRRVGALGGRQQRRRAGLRPEVAVAVDDGAGVDFVPSGDPHDGNLRIVVEVFVHGQAGPLPELVVVVVVEVELEGGVLVPGSHAQRRLPAPPRNPRRPLQEPLGGQHRLDGFHDGGVLLRLPTGGGHVQVPPQQAQSPGPAHVHAVVVGVVRSGVGDHGGQAGRVQRGHLQLDPAHVGDPVGSHLSAAGGMARQPFHRVVAVLRLVPHGKELAARAEAAPAVLDDRQVAVAGEEGGRILVELVLLVVGRPLQDHRKLSLQGAAVFRRQIQVRRQLDSVPHRDLDILQDDDVHGFPLLLRTGGR